MLTSGALASKMIEGRVRDSQGDLSMLLESLRGVDLSDEIFDENVYLDAHGGYCDIFTAKSRRHGGITVAVKRLRVHILHNKDASKMILRELRIWSSLHHPNVLPLLGYAMHGAYPALVSQWMVKGSLRSYMDKTSNVPVLRLARGIADGLLYLHNQGVVHSDLKSDNILMSENDDPLLADFGISSIMTSSSTTNSTTGIKGSARWMAFELLSPRLEETEESGKHSKKTDVWAYGMVVYELLTGHVPFFLLKNDLQVSVAIAGGQLPTRPTTLNDENKKALWSICLICWRVPASKRPGMSWLMDALPSSATYDEMDDEYFFVESSISFPTRPESISHSEVQQPQPHPSEEIPDIDENLVEEGQVVCPVPSCRAVLTNEYIEVHLWSHMREGPFKFTLPGRNGTPTDGSERIQSERKREGPFTCEHCNETFPRLSRLNRHYAVLPYTGLACRPRP